MTERGRVRATTPLLVVSDLQRSIDFYCHKLGYQEPAAWGEPPCFAMMHRDGFDLMLSLADEHSPVKPPHATWDYTIKVTDIAAEIAALGAAGVTLDKGPTDTFYEMREIQILDPDGHRICIAQDISTEDWKGTLDVGAAKLRLVLRIAQTDEGLVGRLDSIDQGAMDMSIDVIVREENALRFEMKRIDARYEGTIDGDELTGTWSQRGLSWPLIFRRA